MSSSILQQIVPRDNNSVSGSHQHDASLAKVVPNVTRNINSEFPGVSLKSSKPITRIVTSKKWVLPPRPKPGRKSSADVPTTKRKAQNRAAQRAFRERRANRVTELEKQLMELEREKSIKEGVLTNTIKTVQNENSRLKEVIESMNKQVSQMSKQMESLIQVQAAQEKMIQTQKSELLQAKKDLKTKSSVLTTMTGSRFGNQGVNEDSVPIRKRRRVSRKSPDQSSKDIELAEAADTMLRFKNSGSASDESGSRSSSASLSDLLNRFKPMAPVPLKSRHRSADTRTEFKEIDFTGKFRSHHRVLPKITSAEPKRVISVQAKTSTADSSGNSSTAKIESYTGAGENADFEESVISPDEKCGFCSEGTPCVCREIANQKHDAEEPNNTKSNTSSVVPSGDSLSQATSLSGSVSIARTSNASSVSNELVDIQKANKQASVCTGNPGSCPQCMSDPMSSLFCTTLANNSKNGAPLSGSTESRSTTSRKTLPAPKIAYGQTRKISQARLPSLEELELENPGRHYIPCPDAYRKLSKHSNFRRERLGNIINNLNTSGMFVEVESIGKCLHLLDREFGNN